MQQQYIVSAQRNLCVCDDLREVYGFLSLLKERGITYATVIGSKWNVRLSEHGNWIWTLQKEPPQPTPTTQVRQTCGC